MPPSRTPERWSTGKWIAAILAVAVHLGFIVFLIFSVTWQNFKPEAVSVELYAPPAQEKAAPPKPAPEPPKPKPEPPKPAPEPPKPQPEPPKPQPEPPKPAPKVEPPPPTRADIALKQKQERERKLNEDKERKDLEKRDADKRDAEKKTQEEKRVAEVRERQNREAEALKAQAERESLMAKKAAEKAADAARSKANDSYIRSIQAKIKGNVLVPAEIVGNPEAIFEVVQLPTGEIIDTQLKKSSGVRAYDDAVQRAIIKSSPLPRPETPDLWQRNLTLRFRPLD